MSALSGTITDRLSSLAGYGSTAIANAKSAMDALAAGGYTVSLNINTDIGVLQAYPLIQPSPISPISVGPVPEIANIVMPQPVSRPDISIDPPPSLVWPIYPDKPSISIPNMKDVVLGAMLQYVIPDVPTVIDPTLPTPPQMITINPTDWNFAIDNILVSDDPMVQAVMDRLRRNILHGGTGLSPDIEAAIWNRDLERNEQSLADSVDKATSMWAQKGFSLPDGILAHSLSELQKEYMNRRIDRSREISIKQAELEQTNIFKSLELSINLTFKLIEAATQYGTLILSVQEHTAKFANEYIRLQIEAQNSIIEVFKARVESYSALIRSNMAKVEIYKAQIEGALAVVNMNSETVKLYSAQIEAEIAKYKGVLEGDQIIAQIFSTEVQAAVSQAGIEETKIKAYAETVRAALAKAEVYKAEMDGMTAEINAERAKIDANVAQVTAWSKGAEVIIENHRSDIELYKANTQYNISTAEVFNKVAEVNIRSQIEKVKAQISEAELFCTNIRAEAQLRMEAARGVATAAASLAAGAMAAASVHAGISYSESQPFTEITQ